MYEQEPTVNDILSSIRQILSNKIEDGNNNVILTGSTNKVVATNGDNRISIIGNSNSRLSFAGCT